MKAMLERLVKENEGKEARIKLYKNQKTREAASPIPGKKLRKCGGEGIHPKQSEKCHICMGYFRCLGVIFLGN